MKDESRKLFEEASIFQGWNTSHKQLLVCHHSNITKNQEREAFKLVAAMNCCHDWHRTWGAAK